MVDKEDDAFLGQNIKGLMMSLVGAWNMRMDAARSQTAYSDIRPADMAVFAQLRGRSMRLSDIHREMGYSRQAAQQAVMRLVAQDMLRVEPDPHSKRDKIVSITEKGQGWRKIAAAQIREIEAKCAEAIGAEGTETLRKLLQELLKRP